MSVPANLQFEREFKTSRVARWLPRAFFYLLLGPLVLGGSILSADLGKDRWSSGLAGGFIALWLALGFWSLLWSWAKNLCFRRWTQQVISREPTD